MPTIHTGTGTLYYTVSGRYSVYPPLLLVHGAGGSRLDWPTELRRLPGAQVWTLDLPGHGRSSGPGRVTIPDYARDVGTFLRAANLPPVIVVGHSMGGAIAQQLALDDSDHVAGLVLIATGSKLPVEPTLPQRALDEPSATIDWLIARAWHRDTSDSQLALARARLSQMSPIVLQGDFLACATFDVRHRLAEIAVPTLVIGAAEDRMVPLKFSNTLAETIPHARLIVIDGAAHMVPLEHPARVTRAIAEWVGEQQW